MLNRIYRSYIKRLLDIVLSLAAMAAAAIPMLVIAVLIKVDSPGPVFFRQKRVGKGKGYFNILKFRTMYTDAPKDMPTHLLKNPDVMITRVGRVLRKTSLDELPQLFNILAGHMSIVGPRPALWNQDDLIEQRDRWYIDRNGELHYLSAGNEEEFSTDHTWGENGALNTKTENVNDLRPGLTGWAQVNGRDELEISLKAAYDGEYLQRLSFGFDCRCILRTAKQVIRSEGVVEGGK